MHSSSFTSLIVTYNSASEVLNLLADLDRHVPYGRVIVIDNASRDETVNLIGTHFPQVHAIRNPANVGFARAVNQGVALCGTEYVLLLNPRSVSMIVKALQVVGQLEETLPLEQKLPRTRASTISGLNAQIREILTTEFRVEPKKHDTHCYFSMSIHDPIIRYDATVEILQKHFSQISAVKLYHPYHQPPTPVTYEELNRDFYDTVNSFLQEKHEEIFFSNPMQSAILMSA